MHGIVRGLALAAALAAATAAHAEDASYPNRPVRIIVPFAAGGPPDVRERLMALGFEPAVTTPAEFGVRIKSEIAKWDKVVRAAHIGIE